MAKGNRQRVLLLFLGGSTIDPRGRSGDTVQKAKDVEPWMEAMSEMNLIAETEGVFVTNGLHNIGYADWALVAKIIDRTQKKFDGFVVIHQLHTIRAAGIALTLMLQHLGKPVVLVGSNILTKKERENGMLDQAPVSSETGVKASIINAVQVAISDLGEVVLIIGSHIYRGDALYRAPEKPKEQVVGVILGKIDFGIRLFGKQKRRRDTTVRLKVQFDSKVAFLEYLPGSNVGYLTSLTKGAHGIFLSCPEPGSLSATTIKEIANTVGTKVPILLYMLGAEMLSVPKNVIPMWSKTRSGTLIRYMWALGQTRDISKLHVLLKQYHQPRP